MTLAERLLAGEHHGCTSWAEVARKFVCNHKTLYLARKVLEARGTPAELIPDRNETKPTVHVCAERESKWPSVEKFDAEDAEPPLPAIPPGYRVDKISTLVDGVTGETKQQWIKTTATQDDSRSMVIDAIANICKGWPVRPDVSPPPSHSDDDLLCVYPMGDPHIGMLAWAPETGENFDLEIAEQNLVSAVDHLMRLAPKSRRALIGTVGDTFHSDGLANTTTKGTRVDVDGRTRKMIDVGVRTFRRLVDLALMRHDEVEIKIAPGNHDALISIFLQVALAQFYEREPRVKVDPSPESFLWYRFGANLIGFNHGHLVKPDALMQVMAVDRAEDWGATRHRRIYRGHYHHEVTKEVPGCTIDTLNTLASTDDWHRRSGYRSTRHMRMDIIHRERGLVNRHIVGIEQLRERTRAA
jgi:hypothetical protein